MKGRVISLFIIDFFSYVYRTNFFIYQIFRAHFVHYTRNFSYVLCQNFVRPANFHLRQISIISKFRTVSNFRELELELRGCQIFMELGAAPDFIKFYDSWTIKFYQAAAKYTELDVFKI